MCFALIAHKNVYNEEENRKREMEIGMKCHLSDSLGSAPALRLMFGIETFYLLRNSLKFEIMI